MAGSVRKKFYEFYRKRNRKYSIKGAARKSEPKYLSLLFATLCVVDLFGVFPIIALPAALISCGFYGLPILLFVITLQIYTAVILGRCWVIAEKLDPTIIRKNRYPYAAVAELIYGKYMSYFVTILLDLTVFGGGIPNLLVASQNLQLLGHRVSNGEFYFSFCYWLILIGLFMCPIMWLGSPKNMKALATISVFTCSAVAILVWFCILDDNIDTKDLNFTPFPGMSIVFPSLENILATYGLIAFQFDIHPMLMTIEVDMQNKSKIGNAVCYGIFITCFMCIVTTIFASYKYGTMTTANVLEILPKSNELYVAIMLVTLQLCLSSAVGSSALFQHIEDVLGISQRFGIKRCLIRSLLLVLAVLIGELVPRFDLVMGLIGGTLTGPLIFILPPIFYTKILKMEKVHDQNIIDNFNVHLIDSDGYEDILSDENNDNKTNRYGTFYSDDIIHSGLLDRLCDKIKDISKIMYSDCVLSIAVILFGLAATFTSTYFNIYNISAFSQFWSPCITNISSSFINL